MKGELFIYREEGLSAKRVFSDKFREGTPSLIKNCIIDREQLGRSYLIAILRWLLAQVGVLCTF